ncbi:MAG: HAD family hydrolase [Lachnospiraceae bacterium]|nr:HAD family hydrolase [Lachnospiraceae bacterium]
MAHKLVFLDIDGTLVSDLKPPSKLVVEAINRAKANGHKVFLCTGRNMPIISPDLLEIGFDGIVASAGGHVETDGQVLFDSLLPEKTIQECLGVFHAYGMYCRIETPEGIYTDPPMESLLKTAKPDPRNAELIRMQKEIEQGIRILPYKEYPGKGAYKICFTSTDLKAIEQSRKDLEDQFEYVVYPYAEGTVCLNGEIIPKGIDKGRGMELICGYYGAGLEETIAFGDSMNDYGMMKTAGISVAMGNASDELKRMADRICESVWEDGVYHEFQRMELI